MPLHPQARAVLDVINQAMPDLTAMEPAAVRRLHDVAPRGASESVARVEERRIPGPAGEIPVRLYAPKGHTPLPGIVYFHGGGFVFCNLDTHDALCRALANRTGAAVVSVDYRLAPEHPYPAAPEDAYAAVRFVADRGAELGIEASRLAVAGDSAGGNLAAVVALLARERGGPALRHQLLVYPITDWDFERDSYRENAEGGLLSRRLMEWFRKLYLPDDSRAEEPAAAPLRAADLAGLPPAHVVTAEFDPLRDEGEAYAQRLREAGVPVTLRRYDGVFHGFFSMFEQIDLARSALEEAADALRDALRA